MPSNIPQSLNRVWRGRPARRSRHVIKRPGGDLTASTRRRGPTWTSFNDANDASRGENPCRGQERRGSVMQLDAELARGPGRGRDQRYLPYKLETCAS